MNTCHKTVRLEEEQIIKIDAIAKARQTDRSETIRYLLQRGIELEQSEAALDHTLRMIRGAMTEAIKPLENRLAAITSKTAITAAQATALLKVMIEQATALDVEETWDVTYQYGVRFLRDKHPHLFVNIAKKALGVDESKKTEQAVDDDAGDETKE